MSLYFLDDFAGSFEQAVDLITFPLEDDVTGRVVVYFCGLQNHTVDTKSTQRDVIIERIRPFCLSYSIVNEGMRNTVCLWMTTLTLQESFLDSGVAAQI